MSKCTRGYLWCHGTEEYGTTGPCSYCLQDLFKQRDESRQENAKLRERVAVAERLCLASSHLLKGAEAIYDPRGDVGPTHWMGTCDKLIAELDRVVGKYA